MLAVLAELGFDEQLSTGKWAAVGSAIGIAIVAALLLALSDRLSDPARRLLAVIGAVGLVVLAARAIDRTTSNLAAIAADGGRAFGNTGAAAWQVAGALLGLGIGAWALLGTSRRTTTTVADADSDAATGRRVAVAVAAALALPTLLTPAAGFASFGSFVVPRGAATAAALVGGLLTGLAIALPLLLGVVRDRRLMALSLGVVATATAIAPHVWVHLAGYPASGVLLTLAAGALVPPAVWLIARLRVEPRRLWLGVVLALLLILASDLISATAASPRTF